MRRFAHGKAPCTPPRGSARADLRQGRFTQMHLTGFWNNSAVTHRIRRTRLESQSESLRLSRMSSPAPTPTASVAAGPRPSARPRTRCQPKPTTHSTSRRRTAPTTATSSATAHKTERTAPRTHTLTTAKETVQPAGEWPDQRSKAGASSASSSQSVARQQMPLRRSDGTTLMASAAVSIRPAGGRDCRTYSSDQNSSLDAAQAQSRGEAAKCFPTELACFGLAPLARSDSLVL